MASQGNLFSDFEAFFECHFLTREFRMRRISLFFLCIGVVTMSCEDGGYVGNCVNNALLGEVGCQCVTPDNAYSRLSKGYLDPELDDLHYCADSKQPYYQSLNDSEIYVCNSYRCGVKACGSDEIPDADRRTCIKKAVCNANEVYDATSNTCKCDTSNHWEGEAGSCKCNSDYEESSGQCVPKQNNTCDAVKEVYDAASKTCKCDTSNHWEGEAGSCKCRSGDVEISGQCVTSAEATCDAVKEVYDKDSNTCKCDTSKFFEGEAGACTCVKDRVQIGNTCEEKQTCRKDQVYDAATNSCVCQQWFMEQDGECVEYCLGDKEVRGEDGKCSCSDDYVRLESRCIAPSSCVRDNATLDLALNTYQCDEGTQLFLGCCKVLTVGETVTFGSYPQTAESTEKSPITWQILEIKDDAVLLLSKYVLEQYQYHDKYENITWEKSNVRSYLNALSGRYNLNNIDHTEDGFLKHAFTAEEQKRIKEVTNKNPNGKWNNTPGGNDTADKVFLLSHDEVLQYFPTRKSQVAPPTAYAIRPPEGSGRNNLYTCEVTCSGDDSCSTSSCNNSGTNVQVCSDVQCGSYWWLRSPGNFPTVPRTSASAAASPLAA